jgi:hypothetical protein
MASDALMTTFMGSLSTIVPLMLLYNSSSSSSYDHPVNLNATTANATSTAAPFSLPFSLPLPHFLLSLIAKNQDVLKLLLLGGLLETGRRYAGQTWDWLLSQFFFTVHFESTDDTYRE